MWQGFETGLAQDTYDSSGLLDDTFTALSIRSASTSTASLCPASRDTRRLTPAVVPASASACEDGVCCLADHGRGATGETGTSLSPGSRTGSSLRVPSGCGLPGIMDVDPRRGGAEGAFRDQAGREISVASCIATAPPSEYP